MRARSRPVRAGLALLVAATLAGCGLVEIVGAEDSSGPGHSHGPGDAHVSLPVGDGTDTYEVGYTLADAFLPEEAGVSGEMGFRIDTFRGVPQTEFLVEQTKEMHVYVVRDDLAVFRHVHPERDDDGTWTTQVMLPEPGDYRVIAEFIARDEGGNGDHVILGDVVSVGGDGAGTTTAAVADVASPVEIAVRSGLAVGDDGRLRAVVTDAAGQPVRLDTYLGTFAHLTGFHHDTGALVHMHPMGQPDVRGDGTHLEFHTAFEKPGDYTLFVQVRIDGYLHTLPVDATVSAP